MSSSLERVARLFLVVSCVLLLISLAFSLYLGDFVSIGLGLLAGAGSILSLSVLVVWLLARPVRSKLRFVIPAAGLAALSLALAPLASYIAWPLYLSPRQASLDRFVQDLVAYGRIREMDDGLRFYKSINGKSFDSSDQQMGSADFPSLAPILASEQIDPVRYEDFRRRLIALGFIEVAVTEHFVALVYDGFLDNLHGVLWVPPGSHPPEVGSLVFGTDLVSLRELGDGWFAFGST